LTAHDGLARLYKSRADRIWTGVGGWRNNFNLDSTLVRLAWVLLILVGGGDLLYLVAMINAVDRRETPPPWPPGT